MLNHRLHRSIFIGITGIVLFSVAGAWLLVSQTSLFFAFVCGCMVVALAIMLARKMEKTDRQLESFFSAIKNNDFNAHFTQKKGDKFLNNLFRELEERRFYYESIIRVLTHEIRNSITPIASLSADLIKYSDEYGKAGMLDGLQTIHQQAQQLNTFLNAYHRLTHLPDPVKTKVNISTLFDKLSRLLKSEPGCENVRYTSSPHIEILLDPNLITLALINLIRNALQTTANNPNPEIKVEAIQTSGSFFLQVTDNGEGIPDNRLDDIFTPFYSTKKEGSGIGLPLSRRIMQLHGGELLVNVDPGEKTVFRMIFPNHLQTSFS